MTLTYEQIKQIAEEYHSWDYKQYWMKDSFSVWAQGPGKELMSKYQTGTDDPDFNEQAEQYMDSLISELKSPAKEGCERCLIEASDREAKQMPKHTCGKDGVDRSYLSEKKKTPVSPDKQNVAHEKLVR